MEETAGSAATGNQSATLAQALRKLLQPLRLADGLELKGADVPRSTHLCRTGDSQFRQELCFLRVKDVPSPPKEKVEQKKGVRIGGGYHVVNLQPARPPPAQVIVTPAEGPATAVVLDTQADGAQPNGLSSTLTSAVASAAVAVEQGYGTPYASLHVEGPQDDRWALGAVPADRLRFRQPAASQAYHVGAYTRGDERDKYGDRRQGHLRSVGPAPRGGAMFRVLSQERRQREQPAAPGASAAPEAEPPEVVVVDEGNRAGIDSEEAAEALDGLLAALGLERGGKEGGTGGADSGDAGADTGSAGPQVIRTECRVGDRWSVELCYICADRIAEKVKVVEKIVEKPVVVEKEVVVEKIVEVEKPVIVDRPVQVTKEVIVEKVVAPSRPPTCEMGTQTDFSSHVGSRPVDRRPSLGNLDAVCQDPADFVIRVGGGFVASARAMPIHKQSFTNGDAPISDGEARAAIEAAGAAGYLRSDGSVTYAHPRTPGSRGPQTPGGRGPPAILAAAEMTPARQIAIEEQQKLCRSASKGGPQHQRARSQPSADFQAALVAGGGGGGGYLVGSFVRGSARKQRFSRERGPRGAFRVYRSRITPPDVVATEAEADRPPGEPTAAPLSDTILPVGSGGEQSAGAPHAGAPHAHALAARMGHSRSASRLSAALQASSPISGQPADVSTTAPSTTAVKSLDGSKSLDVSTPSPTADLLGSTY